jgi:HAMP domain-containing protein
LNLRTLSTATFVFFGAIVLAHAAGLAWASSTVWESAVALEHDVRAVDATLELDRALRECHRLQRVIASTRDPALEAARSELLSGSKTSLAALREHVGTAEDRRLLGLLEAQLSAYERTPQSAQARDARFDRVLAASAALREQHAANRRRHQVDAEAALRAERWVSVAATALVALGFAGIAVGIQRLVVRPLFELERAVYRIRAGVPSGPVSGGVLAETRALAESLDELTRSEVLRTAGKTAQPSIQPP